MKTSEKSEYKSLRTQHAIMLWLQDNLPDLIKHTNPRERPKILKLQDQVHTWEIQDMVDRETIKKECEALLRNKDGEGTCNTCNGTGRI